MNVPKIIERAGERVLTTAQIAEAYGADAIEVSHNFANNKSRYVEGKHFYLLTGESLRKFKRDCENLSIAIPKNVNRYYLWTERGALLHAKSLNTDKAWAVYDFLVEHYFRKEKSSVPQIPREKPTPAQVKQKQAAALLSDLRRKQEDLAIAEAELAVAKASASGKRRAVADFVMLHPELMPYVTALTMDEV